MRFIFLPFLLWLGTVAHAELVSVKSGEHDGFTRLVIELPGLRNRDLAKTADGYRLVVNVPGTTFDLTGVYRRISRERLSKIYVADGSGDLTLVLDCICHAVPFELGNVGLVIDIKDGSAPEEVPFEKTTRPEALALGSQGRLSLQPSKLHETESAAGSATFVPPQLSAEIVKASRLPETLPIAIEQGATSLLRNIKSDLLWELSKGAADGVIDPADQIGKDIGLGSSGQFEVARQIGVFSGAEQRQANRMTAAGARCIPDSDLNIGGWLDHPGSEIAGILASNTTDLVGEFDRPNPVSIKRAVRFYLGMGFGAEARLVLNAFDVSIEERAVLETLSYIFDLQRPLGSVFDGMEVCDSSAALWSLLSVDAIPPVSQILVPAVLRSFSALPLHLRRLLGPGLVSRFLVRDEVDIARSIQDSIVRATGGTGPDIQMMKAEIALATGDDRLADEILKPLSGNSGVAGLLATVALVKSQVALGDVVSVDLMTTAEALLYEAAGGENEHLLTEALAQGYASQNRFAEAFDLFPPRAPKAAAIWDILAARGNDEALLHWGVFSNGVQPPALAVQTREAIARRLLALGFPDQALSWIGTVEPGHGDKEDEVRLLAAMSEMALNLLPQALGRIEGLENPAAQKLRGQILLAMRADTAFGYLVSTGQSVEAVQFAKLAGKWSDLQNLGPEGVWGEAVGLVTPQYVSGETGSSTVDGTSALGVTDSEGGNAGTLSQTRALLAENAEAVTTLKQLLAN
jgi:hypothetical protein